MPASQRFEYEGTNYKGIVVNGEINATNENIARALLKRQGLTRISIKKKNQGGGLLTKRIKKVSALDIAILTRQLSTMTTAGIPLVKAFDVIIDGSDHTGIVELVSDLKKDVESGTSFSGALIKKPLYFDDLFCNLVASGEQSGTLDVMLNRIAIYKEKTENLKRKIKKAMYYPVTIVVVSVIVTIILLVKVVPTFKDLFAGFGADLPAFTQFILNISEFVQSNGIFIFIILAASGYGIYWAFKNQPSFRHAWDRFSLKIPIFGPLIHKAVIARFARTLSTTFAAGVPLPDALTSVAKASNNIIFYNAIIQIRDNVTSGQQLFYSMRKSGIFPSLVVQMVGIGEESGALDDMLKKVAEIYEQEVDNAVDGLSTLLEPFIMIFLGVIVGGLLIGMYLPIFKLGSAI